MPFEQDVKLLREHILKKTKELTEDKYHFWDYHSLVELRNNTCSRLTLFNAWRGDEPARLFVNEWDLAEKGEWLDNNIAEVLQDPLKSHWFKDMKITYQTGKGNNRLVPVLIPFDLQTSMRILCDPKKRLEAGILNP